MSIKVEPFFDKDTFTLTYIVFDTSSKDAIIIDPVMDFDTASSKVTYTSVEKLMSFLRSNELKLKLILETHAHADHLTGSAKLNELTGAPVAIGKNITAVQDVFAGVFNMKSLDTDGSQFDVLLDENQVYTAGSIIIKTIFTPGHTPACASYLIEGNLFTGDALFMPDSGTGRCDFPAGSAHDLYNSIRKIYDLPDETIIYTGHDYQPGGRDLMYRTTIGESKRSNIQLRDCTSEKEFTEFRTKRDATLSAPKLLLPSVQVNINAGHLPIAEDNGKSYLKLPVSVEE